MSIIVSNCQHCDEQQFQTLSCVHALDDFSVVKFIYSCEHDMLLDRIGLLHWKTLRVRLAYILFCNKFEILWLYQSCSTDRRAETDRIVITTRIAVAHHFRCRLRRRESCILGATSSQPTTSG